MSPHRCRHSAITAVLEKTDGNVRKAQKLSRHAIAMDILVRTLLFAEGIGNCQQSTVNSQQQNVLTILATAINELLTVGY